MKDYVYTQDVGFEKIIKDNQDEIISNLDNEEEYEEFLQDIIGDSCVSI